MPRDFSTPWHNKPVFTGLPIWINSGTKLLLFCARNKSTCNCFLATNKIWAHAVGIIDIVVVNITARVDVVRIVIIR